MLFGWLEGRTGKREARSATTRPTTSCFSVVPDAADLAGALR
jgi:hypothetical protein